MKNLKITKGEWQHTKSNTGSYIVLVDNTYIGSFRDEANAILSTDAGTTANKCGKLPSELLSERDEFAKLLVECWNIFIEKEIPLSVTTGTELENAINKITGK